MDEFGLIARDLAPLAGEGARGLVDDVAIFAGHAVTTDTIACGTHFLPNDPLDTVARKVLRVNISDLVAKGCRPVALTLACGWPAAATEGDHAVFAQGLGEDLAAFGLSLLGGDTTRLLEGCGPVFTVTMFGRPLRQSVPKRSGARAGDVLFVSGTIGDAMLGLGHLTGAWNAKDHAQAVTSAYRLPSPPTSSVPAIAAYATASVDVSDGLIADARHIAMASDVTIAIEATSLPLSDAGRAYLGQGGALGELCSGGDDYQALVVVDPTDADNFALESGFSRIGVCRAGNAGARLIAEDGCDITPEQGGYKHF